MRLTATDIVEIIENYRDEFIEEARFAFGDEDIYKCFFKRIAAEHILERIKNRELKA